jgi:hypothetical protein
MTTESRTISEEDGVKVRKDSRPRLYFSKDLWGNYLVRMHPQDKKHLQRLYLFLAEHGYDVLEKKDEFSLMGRLSVSANWEKDLKKWFRLIGITEVEP